MIWLEWLLFAAILAALAGLSWQLRGINRQAADLVRRMDALRVRMRETSHEISKVTYTTVGGVTPSEERARLRAEIARRTGARS